MYCCSTPCRLVSCPWLQVYTIVTTALEGSSPPGRTAVCELLDKLSEPVPYLQTLFQPISSRVSQVGACRTHMHTQTQTQPTMEACIHSCGQAWLCSRDCSHGLLCCVVLGCCCPASEQVLELAVSPVLDHVASAGVLEQCSVFDVTRLGQTQLGITGMSLDKTYRWVVSCAGLVQLGHAPPAQPPTVVQRGCLRQPWIISCAPFVRAQQALHERCWCVCVC